VAVSIDPVGVQAMSTATLGVAANLSDAGRQLQSTIDTVDDLVGYRPVVSARIDATAGDLAQIGGWANDLVDTYVDDERPLQVLKTLGYWLPDFTVLGWDSSLSAAGNLDRTARSDEFGSFVLGTAQGLLERYRQFSLYVPKPGVTPPLHLGPLSEPPSFLFQGKTYVKSPGGLLLPNHLPVDDPALRALVQASDGPGWFKPGERAFVTNPEFGRPPTWAKVGGRSLFVVGAGLSIYDAAASQWEQDDLYHPEWSTEQKVASATYSAATEGGGAIAGAWAGGEIGAVVGSFVPIPVVGTLGGALIGAGIGGFIGSKAGKALGDAGKSAWHSLFG